MDKRFVGKPRSQRMSYNGREGKGREAAGIVILWPLKEHKWLLATNIESIIQNNSETRKA